VYAMNPAVDIKNTIYLGYGPTSLTVTAIPAGGSAPYTYRWNTSDTTASIPVNLAGTYTVVITDLKGCTTTASIVINILDVRCGNDNSKVLVCHNDFDICVDSSAVQAHLKHGDHVGSCSAYTSGGTNESIETTDVQSATSLIVYPNPATEAITIKLNKLWAGAMLKMFNARGQMVLANRMTNNRKTVSLKSLTAGVYYLQVRNGEFIITKKIVKQ